MKNKNRVKYIIYSGNDIVLQRKMAVKKAYKQKRLRISEPFLFII